MNLKPIILIVCTTTLALWLAQPTKDFIATENEDNLRLQQRSKRICEQNIPNSCEAKAEVQLSHPEVLNKMSAANKACEENPSACHALLLQPHLDRKKEIWGATASAKEMMVVSDAGNSTSCFVLTGQNINAPKIFVPLLKKTCNGNTFDMLSSQFRSLYCESHIEESFQRSMDLQAALKTAREEIRMKSFSLE